MKIFGWPADKSGCAWYRIISPLTALKDMGAADIQIDQIMPREVLDDENHLIVLQRSTNPTAMMALEHFAETGRRWVYDIDDLLWAVEPDNPAYKYYSDPIVRGRLKWHMENSPVATASTPNLADEMVQNGARNVHVVPNTIPSRIIDNLRSIVADTPKNDTFTIFWRGSPTHSKDIETIRYAMKRAGERGDVRIVLAGTDYRKQLGVPDAEFMPWVPDTETYLYEVAKIRPDVALCPLKYNRFNYSKSHVNALEAMAVGAVPLCSRISAYQDLIDHQANGFLIGTNADDWHKTLRSLIEDRDSLDGFQNNITQSVDRFTTENWKDTYLDVYQSAN